MENWYTCHRFPQYEISDHGHIRSISGQSKPIKHPHHKNKNCNINRNGSILAVIYDKFTERMKTVYVTSLMKQLMPKQPTPQHMIYHLDNNKQNNKLTNLRWMTQSEINKIRMARGIFKLPIPGKLAWYPEDLKKKILKYHKKGYSQVKIGKKLGINNSGVSKYLKRCREGGLI